MYYKFHLWSLFFKEININKKSSPRLHENPTASQQESNKLHNFIVTCKLHSVIFNHLELYHTHPTLHIYTKLEDKSD